MADYNNDPKMMSLHTAQNYPSTASQVLQGVAKEPLLGSVVQELQAAVERLERIADGLAASHQLHFGSLVETMAQGASQSHAQQPENSDDTIRRLCTRLRINLTRAESMAEQLVNRL